MDDEEPQDEEIKDQSEEERPMTVGSGKLSRYQIFIMMSSASMNFSSMLIYSVLGPFFPQEAAKKGVSSTVVGLIFGCFALFSFFSSLIFGKYLVQIGAKFMFLSGMLLSGVATILFGLLDKAADGAPFIALCFIVRAADAIGFGAAITASFSILAKAFPNNIASVMGTLEIFTGLGLILGPPLGGFLYQSFGYEVPFIALGSIVLLTVPLNMYILPRYDSISSKESFWKLVTLPKILFLCLVLTSMSTCLTFLDPTMSLFVTETFNLQVGYVGFVFLGLALSYAISSPLLGVLIDKKPHLRKWSLFLGCMLTAVCYVMLGPAPFFHIQSKLWLFVLMLVVLGFSIGLSAIPVFPEMLSCAYENGFEEGLSTLGLISGLFSSMWSIGGFIGPTLGGFLNEKLKFKWAAAIQGGLSLIAGVSIGIFFLRESMLKKRSVRNEAGTEEEHAPLLNTEK